MFTSRAWKIPYVGSKKQRGPRGIHLPSLPGRDSLPRDIKTKALNKRPSHGSAVHTKLPQTEHPSGARQISWQQEEAVRVAQKKSATDTNTASCLTSEVHAYVRTKPAAAHPPLETTATSYIASRGLSRSLGSRYTNPRRQPRTGGCTRRACAQRSTGGGDASPRSPDFSLGGLHVDGADHLLGELGGVPRVHQHGTPDGSNHRMGATGYTRAGETCVKGWRVTSTITQHTYTHIALQQSGIYALQ